MAQVAIQSVSTLAIPPKAITQLTLTGTNLQPPLRVWNSRALATKVLSTDGTNAVIEIDAQSASDCGLLGICVAAAEGPSNWVAIAIDDLPTLVESENHHTFETAQGIPSLIGIEGKSDGPKIDFYRLTLNKDQRIAIEVLANGIGSNMDAVLQVLDLQSNILATSDDRLAGPDPALVFVPPTSGEYILKVFDSKYLAGGRYRLRVGDFPLIDGCLPSIVPSERASLVGFAGFDSALVAARPFTPLALGENSQQFMAARLPEGKSSAWGSVIASNLPCILDQESASSVPGYTIPIPSQVCGRMDEPKDIDRFAFQATEGMRLRAKTRTYSLGSPAVLVLRVLKPDGTKIAESAPGDDNESNFEATIPASGNYILEVEDFLHRGGRSFTYAIELQSGGFELFLKNDPKTKDHWGLEVENGALAIDIQVKRYGYDGPINLSAAGPWKLHQGTVPAGAAEHRVYLQTTSPWNPESLHVFPITGSAGAMHAQTSSVPLLRVRSPLQPYPPAWADGNMVVSGVPNKAPLFAWKPIVAPIAIQGVETTITLPIERKTAEFKDPIAAWVGESIAGHSIAIKFENEAIVAVLKKTDPNAPNPSQFSVHGYGEFQIRGRIESIIVPIQPAAAVAANPVQGSQ